MTFPKSPLEAGRGEELVADRRWNRLRILLALGFRGLWEKYWGGFVWTQKNGGAEYSGVAFTALAGNFRGRKFSGPQHGALPPHGAACCIVAQHDDLRICVMDLERDQTERISVTLPARLRARLQEISARDEAPISQVARRLLKRALEENQEAA